MANVQRAEPGARSREARSLVQSNDRRHDARLARMHIALRGPTVLVAREPLCHDRIAGVLDVAGDEFVANGVPRQALRSTVIESGELKQLAPHTLECLDGFP